MLSSSRGVRPYTNQVTQALTSVANTEVTISHPLLEPRAEVKAAGVLVVTSDRGLAGPYNANVLRTAAEPDGPPRPTGSSSAGTRRRPQGHRLLPLPAPGAGRQLERRGRPARLR